MSEQPNTFNVQCGSELLLNNSQRSIVMSLHSTNSVGASGIFIEDGNEGIVTIQGTIVADNIKTVMNRWTKERILAGIAIGVIYCYQSQSQDFRDKSKARLEDFLNSEYDKPPITLTSFI